MQNPIDVLGVHPSGALARPEDSRDYHYNAPEVGRATLPFDWNKGYDVELDLTAALAQPFAITGKDQMQAGSCGGETVGEYGQALGAAYLKDTRERSAKAYYAQAFVPGGGSNSRVLGGLLANQGLYLESLVPSYPADGSFVTEAFMERVQDVSLAARQDAAKSANMFAYAFPNTDLDSMAIALRDSKGILIGLHGSNNGTWLSSYPDAKQVGDFWSHFMYGGKAGIVNGKRGIWGKQSWGASVAPGTKQYQFLSEDHWKAGRIWDAMTFIKSVKPATPVHVFNTDITYGQQGAEVLALQTALAADGVFNLAPTGGYYDITATAVLKFRAKYGIDSSTDVHGHSVGPRTRAKLNELFGK